VGESYIIDALDLGTDTITIEDIPTGWAEDDDIFVLTVAELWSVPIGNITEIIEPTLLLDDISLTVLPDNVALNRSGVLMLGNQIDDTVMLERSEKPYAAMVDVTGDYVVGAGIVALKWAESGCEDETANIGSENQPPVPPPPPGSTGDPGGTPIEIPPPPGTNQPPTTRPLRHDELIELLDDDHPQYALVANAVMDGDAAGGVLSGTYPDPDFAVDMVTQAELDAHTDDTTDAHDASAISTNTTDFDNNLSSADDTVQKALETLDEMASSAATIPPALKVLMNDKFLM
jgi:hypothetical protein